jgi:hypothetical protein
MPTITCQHSGLTFDAASARAKNHPRVSDLLSRAYRDGSYDTTVQALAAVRKAGGYSDIDGFMTLVDERLNRAAAVRREREERQRQAEAESRRAYKEMHARRKANNALLLQHKYIWNGDWGSDTFDEMEEPSGRPYTNWYLVAPDGATIGEEAALRIVRGETTLEAVRAAEAVQRQAEQTAREAAEREAAAEKERETVARAQVETIRVEPFDHTGFERIYSHMHNPRVSSSATTIYAGTVNGVPAGVVNVYRSYGNDFDNDYWYYCADPDAAGLTAVQRLTPEPGSLAATFDAFFGGGAR